MDTFNRSVHRIVKLGVIVAIALQLANAVGRFLAHIGERPKANRFGWTNFRARRSQTTGLAVVAKCAFERATFIRKFRVATVDDAKRTGHDAVAAAVTDFVLNKDSFRFGANDRASWTRLKATRCFAMFANVGQKQPSGWIMIAVVQSAGDLMSALFRLFEEHHVPPCRCSERRGVVVGMAGPTDVIGGNMVPFFAGHLAGFATNAKRWVGEKADRHFVFHVSVAALV